MATIRQHLPQWAKRLARKVYYVGMDGFDQLLRRGDPLVPPRITALIVGAGDFRQTGRLLRDVIIAELDLKPSEKVLEIGCGWGRVAVALTEHLDGDGSYDGVEIIADAVRWCSESITPRFPRFAFHHADVSNSYSNPSGDSAATTYRLPFPDNTFDSVFLTSVFSHMFPKDIEAYLREIHRVTKPGGRSYITYYLLNAESRAQIAARTASQPFYEEFDGFLSTSRQTPENTIAVPEEEVRRMYSKSGLQIEEPIRFGSWCGTRQCVTYQDAVVASKPAGAAVPPQ